MNSIQHSSTLDVRDLGELALEQGNIIDDVDSIPYDIEDAEETLMLLAEALGELGISVDETDADAVAEAWENVADSQDVTLIDEDFFVSYVQELVVDIGDLPNDIPGYLEIDWKATAENLKVDYSEIKLDGVDYLIRS